MCGPFGQTISLSNPSLLRIRGAEGIARPSHCPCPALMVPCANDQSLHGILMFYAMLIMLRCISTLSPFFLLLSIFPSHPRHTLGQICCSADMLLFSRLLTLRFIHRAVHLNYLATGGIQQVVFTMVTILVQNVSMQKKFNQYKT